MTQTLVNGPIGPFWVYLADSPLLGLTLTLWAYLAAQHLYRACGQHPLANPVAIAVLLLAGTLLATGIPYSRYFEGAQFVHFLLGPATVALAVALHAQWALLRRLWWPLLLGLFAGALAAAASAVLLGWSLGASPQTLVSLAPKSVTTPVAMGIAEQLGGLPSLTAVLVVTTGIWGAATGRWLFDRLGIRDPVVRGFALGVAAHGIGTARAFQVNPTMGAFAGLAMGLAALFNALALPWLMALLLAVFR
jgi:predicted murein hydrolase (TIGR00659 family)